jgi:Chromo (CHRromatin Organisation MOdifier) domain/Transposase family tnp2
MPARRRQVYCDCAHCVRGSGSPRGQLFESAIAKNAHLARLRVENESISQEEIDSQAARLFVSTVIDEGPDTYHSLDRNDVDFTSTIPVPDILGCVNRLSLTTNGQNNQPSKQPARSDSSAQPTPRHLPSISNQPCQQKPKPNRLVTRNLQLLTNIQARISAADARLSAPTHDRLCKIESEIAELHSALSKINTRSDSVTSCKQEVAKGLETLNDRVTELRTTIVDTRSNPVKYDSSKLDFHHLYHHLKSTIGHHYEHPINQCTPAAQVSMFLGVVCSVMMGISRSAGDLIMALIGVILRLFSAGSEDPIQSRTISQVPQSIAQALAKFNLEGRTTVYAACPSCHFTYEPRTVSDGYVYPKHCTHRRTPGDEPCNEPLLRNDVPQPTPLKPFVYHSFRDYLAGLISQHEQAMDNACDDCYESLNHPPPTVLSDVFDGEFIRTFEGPAPRTLFIKRPDNEGRYLFALNIDFFNPEGMRNRGAKASCGVIIMACLNLPLNIRYLPENLYLAGIIPGPFEPRLTDINHYVRPVINDMVIAWDRGFHITRTPKYSEGRNTRSAIAIVVNDLPAARKTAGLGSHGFHIYCSVCDCSNLSTRGRVDYENWVPRDLQELRKAAEDWRDAPTEATRCSLFDEKGVRWSELWRLPYWNPTRQLVVDPMHCLLEGLAKHHSRDVIELCSSTAARKVRLMPAFEHEFSEPDKSQLTDREAKHVEQIQVQLTTPLQGGDLIGSTEDNLERLKKRLMSKNINPLKFVVEDLALHFASETSDPVHPDPIDEPKSDDDESDEDESDEDEPDEDESDNDKSEYEVHAIVDSRLKKGVLEYRVEWKGYEHTKDYRSWEPLDCLTNAKLCIRQFHERFPGKPSHSDLVQRQGARRQGARRRGPTKAQLVQTLLDWVGHRYPYSPASTDIKNRSVRNNLFMQTVVSR